MSANPAHPALDQLSAFALGRLEAAQIDAVESHLASCETCCDALKQMKADTFVGLVREARPRAIGAEAATLGSGEQPPSGRDSGPATEAETRADAASFELPPELARHPRYRIVQLLGTGGMGAVYKAEHRLMQRTVALKVINPKLVASKSAVERFRREVQAAARLRHDNIVHAYDAEQAGDAHYLVMEYVPGTDLSKVLDERGPLPVVEACEYIRQAALGLQHAHESGMVHRDIKPQNLMITDCGLRIADFKSTIRNPQSAMVKILDFGLASLTTEPTSTLDVPLNPQSAISNPQSHLTQAGSLMGTPDYMAPEQARDARSADIRSDIYSLGCTLYTLLTGKVPFPGGSALDKVTAHSERKPQPIGEARQDVPPTLVRVLDKMIAKDPADRYQTPAEVAAALAPLSPLGRGAGGEGSSPRRRLAILAAAAAVLLLGGVIYLATDNGELVIDAKVDDVQLVVNKGGKQFTVIDLKTGSRVERLPSGEYTIALQGNTAGVTFDHRDGFTMTRGKQVTVTVSRRPQMQPVYRGAFGLRFEGWEEVTVPTLRLDEASLTIEAFAAADAESKTRQVAYVAGIPMQLTLRPDGAYDRWAFLTRHAGQQGEPTVSIGSAPIIPGKLTHLAGVRSGNEYRFYVDGKLHGKSIIPDPLIASGAHRFVIGKSFTGMIREVRVSKSVRYQKDFTPALRFEPDADTLALYRFGEGEGETLADFSGNGHHGTIAGARWVRADGSAIGRPGDPTPFLAVGPFDADQARKHQTAAAQHLGVEPEITNSIGMKLRLIPAGKLSLHPKYLFRPEIKGNEVFEPNIRELNQPFYAGVHEVTVGQFRQFVSDTGFRTAAERDPQGGGKVLGGGRGVSRDRAFVWSHPEFSSDDNLPVGFITWHDAMAFCRWLSKKEGRSYRLPMEAESLWMLRAGSPGKYFFGDDASRLDDYSWHSNPGAPLDRPQPVGQKRPNPWGLYDVHGNVGEIFYEWFSAGADAHLEATPDGPGPDNAMVKRGGGYADGPDIGTGGDGWFRYPMSHVGFRVVMVDDLRAPPPRALAQRDEDLLQGEWKIVSVEQNGQLVPAELLKKINFPMQFMFKGNHWGAISADGKIDSTFTLHPEKEPKRMDVKGALFEGMPDQHGIYKLEGDTLTVCVGDQKEPRPVEFTSKGARGRLLIVARRISPDDTTGWTSLFNGGDLTGWRILGGTPATWKVENGIIRGAGKKSSLISDRGFGYFHLRAEVRLNPGAEWGLLFGNAPAPVRPTEDNRGDYAVHLVYKGQTNDIEGHVRMETTFTRDGVPLAKTVINVKPHDWFWLDLIVREDSIDIKLPQGGLGAKELKLARRGGSILLHLASDNSVVEFRKILIKALPSASGSASAAPLPSDQQRLQGVWKVVSFQENGQGPTAEQLATAPMTLIVAGDQARLERKLPGNLARRLLEGTLQVFATETPKRLRLFSPADKKDSLLALYDLQGDKLTLCHLVGEPKGYPSKFTGAAGSGATLLVLERQAPAPAAPETAGKSDGERFQGTWRPERAEVFGEPVPAEIIEMLKPSVTFTADKVTWKADPPAPFAKALDILGDKLPLPKDFAAVISKGLEGVYHLAPTKTPKAIDLVSLGPIRKTMLGIYSFEGDTLKLCLSFDPQRVDERPTEFATKAGVLRGMVVLRWVGPAPSDEDRLQGVWRPVPGERNEYAGRALTPEELKGIKLTVKEEGMQLNLRLDKSSMRLDGIFSLDARKAPKRLTFIIQKDSKPPPGTGSQVGIAVHGIYRFEGARLVLCITEGADRRPSEFATSAQTPDQFLLTLEPSGKETRP
jgi:uncharacterized protein (TIGR03067 family)